MRVVLAALLLAGCAHRTPVNPPIHQDPAGHFSYTDDPDDKAVVWLSTDGAPASQEAALKEIGGCPCAIEAHRIYRVERLRKDSH